MAEKINAYCKICGKGYHVCNSCLEEKTFKPWRTIVDTVEHYKIYLAIHEYTLTKNKEIAKQELQNCNLSGLENFNTEIKNVINEIMSESQISKTIPNTKNYKQSRKKERESIINE